MNFPSRLHALAAFLPGSLVRALQEDTSRPRAGALREQQGSVLFADLTGFITMAEALENNQVAMSLLHIHLFVAVLMPSDAGPRPA